jgi:hypothetical protein
MFNAFSIRPLLRLFLAAVMVWMAYVCLYTARHVPMPVANATVLVIAGGLFFLGALIILRGVLRLFRAYGRTWIG